MEVLQRNERIRRRLVALLAEDRPVAERLLSRLRKLRDEEDGPCFSAALHLLAHLNLPEVQAERLLEDLLRHRDEVTRALGRDPGIRVAAIDYLSNVTRLLANPTIVETSQLERTERSAITDVLTRLYNRRHFMISLELEIRRSERYSLSMSLLMLDLDGFKLLNDEYGHLFGDLVLQRVARVVRRAVREADVPCRFGGEEFAVILPETDRLGAYALAERVRRRVWRRFEEKPIGGKSIRVSVSGGIASYPDDGTDASALVARADQAMYLSKSRGKNRISLYHSERRDQVRYPARSTARVQLTAGRRNLPVGATLVDVSLGGSLIELEERVGGSERVEVHFAGRDSSGVPQSWSRSGRVVRNEPSGSRFRLAVAFDELLPEECLLQQVQRTRSLRAVQGGLA